MLTRRSNACARTAGLVGFGGRVGFAVGELFGVALVKAAHCAARQLVHRAVVGRFGGVAFALQLFGKPGADLVIAVVDEHKARPGRKVMQPAQQAFVVGVAGHARHLRDLGVDLHFLAEQLDFVDAFEQPAAERPGRLVADEQDRAFLAPEVVLEVVADAPGVAHAGGRKDDLGVRVGVDGDRVLLGFADAQAGELQRVLAAAHKVERFLVKAFAVVFAEDGRRFVGQRAVDIDLELAVAFDAPPPP